MNDLKKAIHGVYQEHMKIEDLVSEHSLALDGFLHDLSILITEGLEDGLDRDEMTQRLVDYKQEMIEL